jgi:hypothetical protein
MGMRQSAEYADEIEREPILPAGSGEGFSGYGVMGFPFRCTYGLRAKVVPVCKAPTWV